MLEIMGVIFVTAPEEINKYAQPAEDKDFKLNNLVQDLWFNRLGLRVELVQEEDIR